jgi:hypothetical protein
MRPSRTRLINAARRAMIQRAELQRKLGIAGEAFKPSSLLDRGKYRVGAAVDDTAHAARKQFKDNRLPIALAAVAGIAWLLREPIREHAPRLGRKIQDLATNVADHFRPADEDVADEDEIEPVENDDEAVR